MADSIGIHIDVNGINKTLTRMLDKSQKVRGWLNRVAYPKIIEAQRIRWASEGASEGDGWAELNTSYAIRKLTKFAGYPGRGRKMLIATGRLVDSVTGDDTREHYKLVTESRLEVGTLVAYAKFVDEKRNFTNLGLGTRTMLNDLLREYLGGN